MKNFYINSYFWLSNILLIAAIWIFSKDLLLSDFGSDSSAEVFTITSARMLVYSLLFIFIYRSIIFTLKSTVDRLSKWRSRKEMFEDAEFTLIIETLVLIISILICSIVSFIESALSSDLFTKSDSFFFFQTVVISNFAIIIMANLAFIYPVLGELEFAITEIIFKRKSKK